MRGVKAVVALVAATWGTGPAAAQVPGIDVQFVPKVGFYSPAADLQEATDAAGQIVDERGGSLAVGVAVDVSLPLAPVSFRVGFDYVTGSEFTYEEEGTEVESTGEQSMLAIAGDVVLRPIPRLILFDPYVLAGAGVKRYDFSFTDEDATSIDEAFPDSETDFTVHVGVGLDVGLGPIGLVAELGDYISWYEAEGADGSEMQNDLFIMAGVRLGVF